MNHIFLDQKNGRFALYINGELQFDAQDEHLYHQPFAWLPAALAIQRIPKRKLRVLILGGGDGLALREVLSFQEVGEVQLVDRDDAILSLGRNEFASLNRNAFQDPRLTVVEKDALDLNLEGRFFEIVLCDFTFPRDKIGSALLSVHYFKLLKNHLDGMGILGVNAASPEKTPKAFGCIAASIRAAQIMPRPFISDIPSFAREGYGHWGFLIGSPQLISNEEMATLPFPTGSALNPLVVREAALLPAGATQAMQAAPNQKDELLYYLYNDQPIPWDGPFEMGEIGVWSGIEAPKLSIKQSFAAWLVAPEGQRTLDGLLKCLPAGSRQPTREAVLDRSGNAEKLFHGVNFQEFVNRLLERSRELPPEIVQELHAAKETQGMGGTETGRIIPKANRTFALFMILLLFADFFFKDNFFGKGSGYTPNDLGHE